MLSSCLMRMDCGSSRTSRESPDGRIWSRLTDRLSTQSDLIRGYRRAVLTPNPVEFSRLLAKEGIDPKSSKSDSDLAQRLAKSLGGVTILQKGATDLISNGEDVIRGEVEGGLKRCGGQGDVLSGVLGTFVGLLLYSLLTQRSRSYKARLGQSPCRRGRRGH